MGIEVGIWRIDNGLAAVTYSRLDLEARLQEILCRDISILDPNLIVIGREVPTTFGKRIDLLAINRDGHLVVIELKRDRTPRDIVAQTLEYGAWVRGLKNEQIVQLFADYQQKYPQFTRKSSINDAFRDCFGIVEMPDELNEAHQLVIVASELDAQTERIVTYLAEEHDVSINAAFFRVFKDGDREYLTRAWLREPGEVELAAVEGRKRSRKGDWNGEFYGSFGQGGRDWSEARKYGFFSAGGGNWYSKTLSLLEPGARIWVNVPGTGYVGVGEVTESVVPIDDFLVRDESGREVPILSLPINTANMPTYANDPAKAEYMVRVKWLQTVPLEEAVRETGFFGNQNSVARPVSERWDNTVERLKKVFGVE